MAACSARAKQARVAAPRPPHEQATAAVQRHILHARRRRRPRTALRAGFQGGPKGEARPVARSPRRPGARPALREPPRLPPRLSRKCPPPLPPAPQRPPRVSPPPRPPPAPPPRAVRALPVHWVSCRTRSIDVSRKGGSLGGKVARLESCGCRSGHLGTPGRGLRCIGSRGGSALRAMNSASFASDIFCRYATAAIIRS